MHIATVAWIRTPKPNLQHMNTSSRASQKSSPTKGGSLPASGRVLANHTPARRSSSQTKAPAGLGESLPSIGRPGLPRWKRGFDLALVILSAPLWAPIFGVTAVLIKLISPGPILYRQERVGLGGMPFTIMKFRSMKVNSETQTHEEYVQSLMQNGAAMHKLDDRDSRLIPLGRLMRASGLDELPQIYNVIVGEMSLVGPRPCTILEFSRYQSWQKERVNAAPGLTGYWQVHGKNRTTFNQMIRMDLHYVTAKSLRLDCEIILRTPFALARQVLESFLKKESSSQRGKTISLLRQRTHY